MARIRLLDSSLSSSDMVEFSYVLLNKPLFVPDVLHDTRAVMEESRRVFSTCQPYAIDGDKGKLAGVFFVSNLFPGHECTFFMWAWDKSAITPTTVRFIRDFIDATAEEYGLFRIVSHAADKKLGDVLEHLGMTLEANLKFGYKAGGRAMTLYQYRKIYRGK